MGNFDNLRNAIAEVIKQNGNEEITGDVLQFVLLEMVSGLGAGYRFLGVCTPSVTPLEPDGAAFYIGAGGTYENITDTPVDVPLGSIVFFMWDDGLWTARVMNVGVQVSQTVDEDDEKPVSGGAVYTEFAKLREAGYLFAGVAIPATAPEQTEEKVFYIATAAGEYPNFGTGFTLPHGLNLLMYDGETWSLKTAFEIVADVEQNNVQPVSSGAVHEALSGKVDKDEGKGLSDENFTSGDKEHLDSLPTGQELTDLLDQKQDSLTIDTEPVEDSANPISSGAVFAAIQAVLDAIAQIDLSDFVTAQDVSDAISQALQDYYTKIETDEKIAEAKGELSDIAIALSKEVAKVGESTAVTVRVESNIAASEIVIKRDGAQIAAGSGKTLQFADTVMADSSGSVVYSAELVIGGVPRTVEVSLPVLYPVYYGAGVMASDIVTQASARKTPAGRYGFTAAEDESSIFVIVPVGMSVDRVTMSGIEMPMEAPTGMFIGSVQYLCYKSSNTYDAGEYVINVY